MIATALAFIKGPWGYLLLVVSALAMVGVFLYRVEHSGYERGSQEVREEWRKANDIADRQARIARKAGEAMASRRSSELAAARRDAEDADAKYRRAQADLEARGKPLATVTCPKETKDGPVVGDASGLRATSPAVRITPDGVRLYDGAWTNEAGQPVFGDPVGVADPAAGAAAAGVVATGVGIEELFRVHGENASRCSQARRQLNKLITLIRELQAQ